MRWIVVVCLGWIASACSVGTTASQPDERSQADENFANICAKCHGRDGTGGVPITPGGAKPRDLTDPAWQASVIDAQIETTIRTGKTPMPAFHTLLTTEQIRGLVGKVRRLRKGDVR